jgi:hypothetical protein
VGLLERSRLDGRQIAEGAMKTQSYVGGIAYDGYKKNWTVAEISD